MTEAKPVQPGQPLLLAAIVSGATVVLFVLFATDIPVEVAATLLLGWAQYLIRVLPRAEYHPGKIAAGFAYVAALVVGSHLFLRWVYRETTAGRRWRFVWTLSGAGIVGMMFLSGMAAIGVVHQTAWLVNSPVPLVVHGRSTELANQARCYSNLHQIGLAITLYQFDHSGLYPDDLAALMTEEKLSPRALVCPSADAEPATGTTTQELLADFARPRRCSYQYFGKGLHGDIGPAVVIATEPLSNHDGDGINVLYGDGHVDWLPHDDAAKLLAKLTTSQPTTRATR